MSGTDGQSSLKAWLTSARTRFVLISALTIGLLLIVFGVFVHFAVAQTLISSVDSELLNRIRPQLGGMQPPLGPPPGQFGGPGAQGQGGFAPGQGMPPPQNQYGPPNGPADGPMNGQPQPGQNPPDPQFNPPAREQGAGDPNWQYRPRRFNAQGQPPHNGGPSDQASAPWSMSDISQVFSASGATNGPIFSTIVQNGIRLRVITQRIPDRSPPDATFRRPPQAVQDAYPLTDIDSAEAGVDRALTLLVPVAVLVSVLAGVISTSSIFKRVGMMANAASSMTADSIGNGLPVSGNDEFAQLASTFNALFTRLKSAFDTQNALIERQRRFTADASHELKTPLTIIRGTTSLALSSDNFVPLDREEVDDIDRAASSMTSLVQDLLELARYDDGRVGERASVNVALTLTKALGMVSAQARDRCRVGQLDESARSIGDQAELARVFVNLIENANRAADSDNKTIDISMIVNGKFARIEIADHGIGIDKKHLPKLFDRFYRVDTARSESGRGGGTGLGLAICKSIVESIGGTIRVTSDGVGKGATAIVELSLVRTP